MDEVARPGRCKRVIAVVVVMAWACLASQPALAQWSQPWSQTTTVAKPQAAPAAQDADNPDETDDANKETPPAERRSESWVGAEGFRNVLSIYSGVTTAPFAPMLADGFRLRAVGGGSQYRYTASWFDPALGRSVPLDIRGRGTAIDALAGYQWRQGALTTKVFVGAAMVDYRLAAGNGEPVAPGDFNTDLYGRQFGAKALLELWYTIGEQGFLSLDLDAATAHRAASGRVRLGYRVRPELSLGPEISLFGYRDFDAINTRTVYPFTTRLGAFARYDNGTHEVSLSGGRLQPEGGEGSTYFSGQWLRRF